MFLAALALVFPGTAAGQGVKSDKVVKASAKADKPDAEGKQTVTITLNVEKPYHLYANPVGNDMLKSAQTAVKFPGKVDVVKIDYPAGTLHKDNVAGNYNIYEGKVTIKATVRREKGAAGPLQLTVKIQACTDKNCLLPATLKLAAE
jgi:hypothetical protein